MLEGLFIGGLSCLFEQKLPGIVIQAVMLTFGTLAALLAAYTAGIIMTKGLPFFLPALVGAGLVGILAAILIGFPLLRLKGH